LNIVVKKSETSKIGADILNHSHDFFDDIKKLTAIVDKINVAWSGDDSLKYINTMKSKYLPGLIELKDNLEAYGEYLQDVPDSYMALDETFTSKNIDV
jgi:hypothetical protein